jgi:large subunit ribosomal protein L28
MSFKCVICGKKPVKGKTISHSHRATIRTFKPNLRRQKIVLKGKVQRSLVCTDCIRSGRVKRAA